MDSRDDSLPSLSARFSKFKVRGVGVGASSLFTAESPSSVCVGSSVQGLGVVPTFGPSQMMLLLVFMYTCGCVASFLLDPTSGTAGSRGPSV